MNQNYYQMHDSFAGNVNNDVIWIIPKDPYVLYAYWEVSVYTKVRFETVFGKALWEQSELVIKLTNVTDNTTKYINIDQDLNSIYINLDKPNKLVRVEVGKLISKEFFVSFAGSNILSMPNNNISDNYNIHFENINESKNIRDRVNTDAIYEKFEYDKVSKNLAPSSVNFFINYEKNQKN